MSNVQTMDCSSTTSVRLTRVNYFNRQLLTADDMTTERDYFLQKLRRHNRFLHGWGVVCGLQVTAAPTSSSPWLVQVGSGYALGPYGDEIFVGDAVTFDLAACLSGGVTSPCEPNLVTSGGAGTTTTAWLAIRYAECLARPVQVATSACGCDGDNCQYSRIVDSFQLQCLAQLPDQPAPSSTTLCQASTGTIAPCPPCPTSPWVVLAQITLPSVAATQIAQANIDITLRPVIVSTAVLQAQVIACCCKKIVPPPPPATVVLQSILVRSSAIAGTTGSAGPLGNQPPIPAGQWTKTPPGLSLNAPFPNFDFQLVLSGGSAPSSGFPVNVTANVDQKATVTLASGPFQVPAGQAESSAYTGSSVVNITPGELTTITLTATAADDPENSVTATITIFEQITR